MKKLILNGKILSPTIMNAAGTAKSDKDFRSLVKSEDVGAIVMGSYSAKEKIGNTGNTYVHNEYFDLNAIGLKNPGIDYCLEYLPSWRSLANEQNKLVIISIIADTPEECVDLVGKVLRAGADGVEVNWGCPNQWGSDGIQKEIPSYSLESAQAVLDALEATEIARMGFMGIKVSPFITNWRESKQVMKNGVVDKHYIAESCVLDTDYLTDFIQMINGYDCIKFISTTNTIPNCFGTDENGNQLLSNNNGLGGLSGPMLFPISLEQTKWITKLLNETIYVFSAGGIRNGEQMQAFLKEGADGVQIGGQYYFKASPEVMSHILAENEAGTMGGD